MFIHQAHKAITDAKTGLSVFESYSWGVGVFDVLFRHPTSACIEHTDALVVMSGVVSKIIPDIYHMCGGNVNCLYDLLKMKHAIALQM